MPYSRPMPSKGMMNQGKIEHLEAKGWKVGSVDDFLELTPAESAYLHLKFTLSRTLRDYRKKQKLSQTDLAERINSSQSRIAKMESGDASVSIDLLVRSLFALGVTTHELGEIILLSELALAA